MIVAILNVYNDYYASAEAPVQRIMQNLKDSLDYVSIANTDLCALHTLLAGLVEQDEVESVQVNKLYLSGASHYLFTIRYKGYDTVKTRIQVQFQAVSYEISREILNNIVSELGQADLSEIIGVRVQLGRATEIEREKP